MSHVQRFSYFPAPFILFGPALAYFFIIAAWLVVGASDTGYASLAAVLLFSVGAVVVFLFGYRYFKRPWRYSVTDRALIADRLWGRYRVEISWSDITRVYKATRRDWFRNWPEIEVQARDGTKIAIPSNLKRYTELIEIIRGHATNCREFDAYPAWRLGARAE